MDSLNTSQESFEFWEKIEQPILLSNKIQNSKSSNENPKKLQRKITSIFPPSDFLKTFQMNWNLEKLRNASLRIKEASEEGIRNIGIKVRNKTKKELMKTVVGIQKSFHQSVFEMKKDREKMQEQLSTNTRLFHNLVDHVVHQNFLNEEYKVKESYPKAQELAQNTEIEELKINVEKGNLRFETLKVLNTSFKEEAETALNKVRSVDNEISKLKNTHEAIKKRLEKAYGIKEKVFLNETKGIQEEFDFYKLKISQELRIRQLLENRQQQFIESLYEELKNAKIILQNPTLRLKTYEKLRDFSAPQHSDYLLPKVVGSQLTTKIDSRNLYSPIGGLSNRSTKSNRRTKSSLNHNLC